MKKKPIGLFLGLCAGAIVYGQGTSAAERPSADEKAIITLQARLSSFVSARNLDGVMEEYAPGSELFVFDSDLPRQHSGWASYKEDWWKFLGATTAVKADVEALGVTIIGDAAFSHNLLHLTWTNKGDGAQGEQLMSVSDAYRKINGRWLIVMEHWSLPVVNGKAVLMTR